MPAPVVALPTVESVRAYVFKTLCDHDRLDPEQTQLLAAPILRSGRPCGVFYQVEGPRLLKTYALWAGDDHRILFYDCGGVRFAEARLCESPDPVKACEPLLKAA